jgi:multiple sugar transport system substrate-binding protein
LARTGKLVKVQDYINKDKAFNAKDIPAGLWGLCKYNGEIYGVPFDANNLAIYYNKKIFKDAGVDPAKIVTWADLRAAAKKLTKQGQYGFQVPQGQGEWLVWTWMTGLWQAGGEFLGDNNTKVKFNSKAGADAIQLWYDMVNVDKSSYFSEPGAGYKPDDFIAGRVAMMINGPWNFPVLEKAKKEAGLDYGAIFLPKNKKNATNLGGENMYIFKSNKTKEDAAWKFSKYIMSPDFQADWSMTAGYLPVSTSTLNNPAYKKFLADNPFIKTYADQVKYGLGRPPIAEYDAISAIVGKSLEKVLYGKQSAKDALDEAAKEATAELE